MYGVGAGGEGTGVGADGWKDGIVIVMALIIAIIK